MSRGLLLRPLSTRASELEGDEFDLVVTVCFLRRFFCHWEKLKVALSASLSSLLEKPSLGLIELFLSLFARVVWRPYNPWAEEHTLILLLLWRRAESFVFFIACLYLSWTREVLSSLEKGLSPSQGFLLVRGFRSVLLTWQLSSEMRLMFMWEFLFRSFCLVRISSFTLSNASFLYESLNESTFRLLYRFLSSLRFRREAVLPKGMSLKLDL